MNSGYEEMGLGEKMLKGRNKWMVKIKRNRDEEEEYKIEYRIKRGKGER